MNDDLREMAEGYLNGTLSEAEMSRLESLLRIDAEAKREFAAHLVLHGQLGLVADELRGTEVPVHGFRIGLGENRVLR